MTDYREGAGQVSRALSIIFAAGLLYSLINLGYTYLVDEIQESLLLGISLGQSPVMLYLMVFSTAVFAGAFALMYHIVESR